MMYTCKWIVGVLLAVAVVAAPASANLLVNGGFEGQNLDNWVRKDRATADLWGFPGGGEQAEGDYTARFVEGWFSGNRPNGALTQSVTFDTPFTGDLIFSGWVKRYALNDQYATQPEWGWAEAALYVNGLHGEVPEAAVPLHIGADDTWHYFEATVPVVDASLVDVALGWGLQGDGTTAYKTFDAVLLDGWSLVPEPATLTMLVLPALFLLRRRR